MTVLLVFVLTVIVALGASYVWLSIQTAIELSRLHEAGYDGLIRQVAKEHNNWTMRITFRVARVPWPNV